MPGCSLISVDCKQIKRTPPPSLTGQRMKNQGINKEPISVRHFTDKQLKLLLANETRQKKKKKKKNRRFCRYHLKVKAN